MSHDAGPRPDAASCDDGGTKPAGDAAEDAPTDSPSSTAPARTLALYYGASCTCDTGNGGPGNIDSFSTWLGSPITIGSDYAATDSWANWAFPAWQSTGWQAWRVAHPKNRLILAPGMGVAEDMAGGAAGMYDNEWTMLGQALVVAGFPDAILRIAHEFNGNWYWYQPAGQVTEFIGYWQHIVNAMRSVTGQKFQFFWNPTNGVVNEDGGPFDPEAAYPGDAYVDYIGPDVYDDDWSVYPTSGTITAAVQSQAWVTISTGDHCLSWYASFASMHDKPLALGEWGLWTEGSNHGGGDDPSFVQNIYDWIGSNDVAFGVYFNNDDNAIWPGAQFPNAQAKLKELF